MKVRGIGRLLVAAWALVGLFSSTAAAQFTPTLTASATGTSVAIDWTPITGAAGYNLVVGFTPGGSELGSLNLPAAFGTSIKVNAPPATYYLRVRAFAAGIFGPFSNEASVSPGLEPCVPGTAPTLGVQTNQSLATVAWTPVPGATSYVVQWSRASGITELAQVVTGTSTSMAVPFNGNFFVRVVARSACGDSVSNEAGFTIAVTRRHLSPGEILSILQSTVANYPRAWQHSHHSGDPERYDWIILASRALYQASGGTIGANWRRAVPGDLSMDGLSVENPADGRYYFADIIFGAGGPNPQVTYSPPFYDAALLRNDSGRYAPEGFANPLTLKTYINYGPAGGW
jgi:hypothetical protein